MLHHIAVKKKLLERYHLTLRSTSDLTSVLSQERYAEGDVIPFSGSKFSIESISEVKNATRSPVFEIPFSIHFFLYKIWQFFSFFTDKPNKIYSHNCQHVRQLRICFSRLENDYYGRLIILSDPLIFFTPHHFKISICQNHAFSFQLLSGAEIRIFGFLKNMGMTSSTHLQVHNCLEASGLQSIENLSKF